MTDMTDVQVVQKTTNMCVALHACHLVLPTAGDVDIEMGGVEGGPIGSLPPLDATVISVLGVICAQALVLHSIKCQRCTVP